MRRGDMEVPRGRAQGLEEIQVPIVSGQPPRHQRCARLYVAAMDRQHGDGRGAVESLDAIIDAFPILGAQSREVRVPVGGEGRGGED